MSTATKGALDALDALWAGATNGMPFPADAYDTIKVALALAQPASEAVAWQLRFDDPSHNKSWRGCSQDEAASIQKHGDHRGFKAESRALGQIIAGGWQPTAGNVNALPMPLRAYIHQIEATCVDASVVMDNYRLSEENKALRVLVAAPPAAAGEARDERIERFLRTVAQYVGRDIPPSNAAYLAAEAASLVAALTQEQPND